MELKGSKTEKNLQTAFAGESQAHTKYQYYASAAKKEGYNQIGAIFTETAGNEKEHAKLWFKALHGGAVPQTDRVFQREEKKVWICTNCGKIVIAEKAPEKCPVCDHPQGYFELKVTNY